MVGIRKQKIGRRLGKQTGVGMPVEDEIPGRLGASVCGGKRMALVSDLYDWAVERR